MRMVFTPDEVCKIVRQHLVNEWKLPPDCVENVQFFAGHEPRVEADIKTGRVGGPYRGKPRQIEPDET